MLWSKWYAVQNTEVGNGTRRKASNIRQMRTLRLAALLLFARRDGWGVVVRLSSRPPHRRRSRFKTPIPFDAAVRRGTLPNGLQFFIRQNGRPAKRVSLRLAVKAGSLDEADDQQGLAHFLEHMAFNGSEHFKPGELVSYFESTGAQARSARQRLHELRRNGLHARPADRHARGRRQRASTALADFAGGLTLDAGPGRTRNAAS